MKRFRIGDFAWRYLVSIHGRDQVILKISFLLKALGKNKLVLNKGLFRLKALYERFFLLIKR